ncbi:tail fiber protein [uncultured Caulobacter sp.]|uniref:phage tail protein n=1 Tax=uncultured Caulobacter sp. TaxID=158749 RepID=UPI0026315B79|nr:tail fiber protein [uncultured Caulobacter sp.]
MSDPFIGQIMQVGFAYAPVNWLTCRGQVLQVGQNQALFALLSNRFGGNGTSNFALPDAQGRAFIGTGNGVGLTPRQPGDKGGVEQQSLSLANLPTHTHTPTVTNGAVTVSGSMTAMTGVSAADETPQPTPGGYLGTVLEQDTSPVLYVPANTPGTPVPLGGMQISAQSTGTTVTIQPAGNSAPVSMMPPFLAVTTIIASVGIWPEQP